MHVANPTGKGLYPIGHPDCKVTPGRVKGSRNIKGTWRELEDGIVSLIGMSLDIFDTKEDKDTFHKKMKSAAQKNPVDYMVRIVLPMLKALPPDIKIMVLNKYMTSADKMDQVNAVEIIASMIGGQSRQELEAIVETLEDIEDGDSAE